MQIEIAPQHHLFMMGKGGANVRQIMQHTGASIHFPDPSTVHAQRRGVVYVTGLIESVYQARQQLIVSRAQALVVQCSTVKILACVFVLYERMSLF